MTDEIERREAEKLCGVHRHAIEEIDRKIATLKRLRDARQDLLDKAELSAKGIKPCLICNRHVPSPCNTKASIIENGPWDCFCREFTENRS